MLKLPALFLSSKGHRVPVSPSRLTVIRIVQAQFLVTFLLATALLVQSQAAALSYVSGGLTIALPSAFMAWRTGRRVARPAAALVILINAEIGKLLLTALMMGAVFVWVEALQPGWYFTALVVGMMCNIMVPLLWRGRRDTGYDRPTQDSAQE